MKRPIVFGEAVNALFRLDRPTAVSAGAGSGKTTSLVELCVRLLSGEATGEPLDPGELSAITFTDRAGEELVERLREAVAERARHAPPAEPGPSGAKAWIDRLHALDRMRVGTIHGFCGRLLRERAPEAGLDPDFTVVDEERAASWLAEAARAAVVAALDEAGPAARALAAGLGAAGSGGGLAAVVAGLVRERATRGDRGAVVVAEVDPGAAREARTRLRACADAVAGLGRSAAGDPGRALAEEVLHAFEPLAGSLEGESGPFDAEALAGLAALASAGKGKRLGKADAPLREARDALRAAAGEVALLEAERLAGPQKEALARLVEETEARYSARKRAERSVDFDDLLVRARDLLQGDEGLRAELRGSLRALLVDEYQDVNRLQEEIFALLTGGTAGDASASTTSPDEPRVPLLVAVGDLKQSIYRFRGADVSVFLRLVRRLERGGGRVLPLAENHRSAPAVLDLVNETFERAMRPQPGEPRGDDVVVFGEADRLVARRSGGARPACEILVEDDETGSSDERRGREAEAIARRIGAIVSGAAGIAVQELGPEGEERPRRPRFGDVAILFRRLTQVGAYERALREAGIPYRLARGGGFYQAPEVRDLGELVASLHDPGDALAWAALLRSPLCLVSDATLLRISRAGLHRLGRIAPGALRREVEADLPPLPEEEWSRLERFLSVWADLRALRDRIPPSDLIARAVDLLDLDAAHLAGPDGARRAENLAKALSLARRFEEDGGRAADFARHLRALAARPPREPEAELESGDAVAILSVHQAKGLEWPVVFVPDLGARPRNDARRALLGPDGRLCAALFELATESFHETASLRAAREAERRAARAESVRILYVALTRARDHLVLSGGRNGPDSWRALVEAATEGRPDLARKVPYAEAASAAAGPLLPPGEPRGAAESTPLAAPRLAGPAPVAAVRVAVTDLAEYARCPRRHHLGRFLGIPEPRSVARALADDPARATARGTLAHAMLCEADLGAPPLERRAQMSAAAARRGYDPASPGVRRILSEVTRFADSAAGRALAQAARDGRLSREVPFLLRLPGRDGPSAYLVGAIDALVRGRRGEGLTVVDYKYATPRPEAVERYRLQLLAYALAARRAHPGSAVRARLQFLRGDLRALDVTPSERDLVAFAREAPALAWDAHRGAGDRTPGELGRSEARCRAEGCGYVGRCFPGTGRPTGRSFSPLPLPGARP